MFDVRYHEMVSEGTCTLCSKKFKDGWRTEFLDGSMAGNFCEACLKKLRRMKAKASQPPARPATAARPDGVTNPKGGVQ